MVCFQVNQPPLFPQLFTNALWEDMWLVWTVNSQTGAKKVLDRASALLQSIIYKIECLTYALSIFVLNIRDPTVRRTTGTGNFRESSRLYKDK